MARRMSPLSILLAPVLVASIAVAADPPAEAQQTDPVVLAESVDAGTPSLPISVEQTSSAAHEARHAAAALDELLPDGDDPTGEEAFSTVVADESERVCKDYGEVCRRSRQCCAPLRCAFDGYAYYCRY